MGWQDSFTPDAVQQAAQSQGWQSSFVPDSQAHQPASNINAQAEGVPTNEAVQNTNIGTNQQTLPQSMYEAFSDKPGTEYGSILPLAHNNKTGETGLAWPEAIRSPARGLAELLSASGGQFPAQTDTSPPSGALSGDALGALTLMSPTSVASSAKPLAQSVADFAGGNRDIPEISADSYGKTTPAAAEGAPVVKPTNSDLKLITQKLTLAGITPEQYADALTKSAPDEFAAEVGGDPLRIQAQALAKLQGPNMQTARDAMRMRLAEAPQRTQQIIEKTFFPSSTVADTVGADPALAASPLPKILPIEQAQGNLSNMYDKASELYTQSSDDQIPRRGLLQDLNTTQGQQAMQRVLGRPSVQKSSLEDLGIIKDPNTGFIGLNKTIPASTAQMFSEELGQNAERNQFGQVDSKLGYEEQAQGVHANEYIGSKSPTFGAANANSAGANQGSSAFDMGRKLAHSAAGDNADQIMQIATDKFSPQEMSLFKTGYAQGLSDSAVGAPIGGGSPASRIAKGTVTQTASNIIGPDRAQDLANALMREKHMMDFANRGLNNSVTAETASAAFPEIPTSAAEIGKAAIGKVLSVVNKGSNDRMSSLLFATSPEQKNALADALIRYNQ